MKTILRILGRIVLAGMLVLVLGIGYSTAKGYSTWYFRVNGSVIVDGHETGGYMHANTQHTILLITRTDGSRAETYLVPVESGKAILDCGTWHPIRFLPNVVGDLNPRCSAVNAKTTGDVDSPASSTLVRASRSIQFTTTSGKKVKAEW